MANNLTSLSKVAIFVACSGTGFFPLASHATVITGSSNAYGESLSLGTSRSIGYQRSSADSSGDRASALLANEHGRERARPHFRKQSFDRPVDRHGGFDGRWRVGTENHQRIGDR
jgi:hypothetical protein